MVVGLNDRDKQVLNLAMEKLLNPELFQDDPIVFKVMQVHENEEYQSVSLAKYSKHVLPLLHNIYTNNNKRK